jgi:peptidoglycan/LPS O-acetylase OafA/YrhL
MTTRIPCLDGLRGIAAIAVMEFHFAIFFLPQAKLFDILPGLDRAYLAVDLFFMISGFVMAHVYGQQLALDWRGHWLKFGIARFARLYPAFAATTLFMVIAFVLFREPLPLVSLSGRSLALQPLLLQQWAPGLSWNYPSWSISTEAEAYIYFVFFAGLVIRGNPRLVAVCCIFVIVALSVSKGGTLNYFVGGRALLRTIAEFSLGVLLYRASSREAARWQNWVALSAVLLAGGALLTRLDFLMVSSFGCVIFYCANATNVLAVKLLNSRPSVAVGDWSYSIYLWHAPTHYAVTAAYAAIGYSISNLSLSSARLLVLATSLAVVGISAVNYRYFEMPMRRLILTLIPRSKEKDHRPAATHARVAPHPSKISLPN